MQIWLSKWHPPVNGSWCKSGSAGLGWIPSVRKYSLSILIILLKKNLYLWLIFWVFQRFFRKSGRILRKSRTLKKQWKKWSFLRKNIFLSCENLLKLQEWKMRICELQVRSFWKDAGFWLIIIIMMRLSSHRKIELFWKALTFFHFDPNPQQFHVTLILRKLF